MPKSFSAQARLQIAAQAPKILFQTVETQEVGSDAYKRYQSTQQALVKSQLVLNAALSDPKIRNYSTIRKQVDQVAWLQEKLKVDFLTGSEVMEITLSGDNPEEVAGIVNAVKKAYMDEVVNKDAKQRTDRHSNLKKIKDRYAENLKQRRETKRKLAETVGSDDRETLALRQQYAMEHLAHLQKELLSVQSKKRLVQSQLKTKANSDNGGSQPTARDFSDEDVDALVDREPGIAKLIEQLEVEEQRHSREVARQSRVSRSRLDPALRLLTIRVDSLRAALEKRRAAQRPIAIRRLESQGAEEHLERSDELDHELATLEDVESQLKQEMKSISGVNQSLTVNTLDLQAIQDDVSQMEGALNKVASEVEALNIELSAPPRIRVIDDATVPRGRDDKKRFMMVALVTLGSFFAGVCGISFLELLTRKVDTPGEVAGELGLTVVGALPRLPARIHKRSLNAPRDKARDQGWRDHLLESIDATRTMLLHAARTGSHTVVMIASAVSGEGKTSLASYLAASLARCGLKTLLVDADLRSPSIHRLFDLPVNQGLSELIRAERDVDEVLVAVPIDRLTVLPAGQCDRLALTYVAQGCLGSLFDRLKAKFDFIIVDTAPILPVADSLLVAQHVDAVLFSILQDVSQKSKVSAAIERVQTLGVQVLGAVVTGTAGGLYGDRYYGSESQYSRMPDSVSARPLSS
jgi:capsular exopolysaccharide synthesis family protein